VTSSRRRVLQGGAALVGTVAASFVGVQVWARHDRGPAWGRPLPFLTAQDDFYNRFDAKKFNPEFYWTRLVDRDRYPHVVKRPSTPWMLHVDGDVAAPFELSERGVRHAASEIGEVHLLKTLRCTGDGPDRRLASNGVWTGVPLRPVLERAGPRAGVRRLRIHGEDGFTANLRWGELETPDGRSAMLAYELNGEPMSEARGGPVRLIVPDRYGFKNIKWPVRVEHSSDDSVWGNHEADILAGLDAGTVEIGSKVLDPDIRAGRAEVSTTERGLRLRGVALPGLEAIAGVQVSVDRGPWEDALLDVPGELAADPRVRLAHAATGSQWPMRDVWVQWWFPWTAPAPGRYWFQVRATGASGAAQPAHDRQPLDGDSRIASCWIEVTA